MRNQCLNAPGVHPPARNLADMGWVAPGNCPDYLRLGFGWVTDEWGGELVVRRMSSGQEAMVKACCVAMAMVQGHSWMPARSNGQQ